MRTDFYLEVVTGPTSQPVTLSQVKDQLSYPQSDTENDAFLTMLLRSAVSRFEAYTARVAMQRSLRVTTHYVGDCIELPLPPFVSLTSISGKEDIQHDFTALATEDYTVIGGRTPAEIVLHNPQTYIQAEYVCGYTDADNVPDDWKLAILQIVTFFHENRGDVKAEFSIALQGLLRSLSSGTVAGYWYV